MRILITYIAQTNLFWLKESKMEASYYCKIKDISQIHDYCSDNVRWLDPVNDYELIKDYFSYFNVHNSTDTYFGISLDNMIDDWSDNKMAIGRLCGYVLDNEILSFAAIEYASNDIWELRAVSTRPDLRSQGRSKCVCSFIVKYILEQGKQAICETNISNFAMQSVTKKIGMVQYNP